MLRYIGVLCLSLLFNQTVFSQGVTATNYIQAAGEPNEYIIKTTISGLEGVDIARITYFIPKEHTFKKSPNNSLFHKREDEFVKFYIMGVPPSGVIDIELGVLLSGEESVDFPVEFQYSQNEEKKVMKLSSIKIEKEPMITADVDTKEEVREEEKQQPEEEQLLQEKIAAAEKAAEEEKAKQEKLLAKQQEEERLKQQKAEEEERRIKEEKEKEAALALKQEEERLAEEKAAEQTRLAEEEKAKKEQELAMEQQNEEGRLALEKVVEAKREEEKKAQQEAELLVKQKVEEERLTQAREAAAKLEAEKKAKEEAELLAKEKAAEQIRLAEEEKAKQEAELLAKQKAEEELLAQEKIEQEEKEKTTSDVQSKTTQYAVQILALSNYSEQRVADFCNKNGLSVSEISTEKIGGLTKVRYGSANSLEQAKEIRNKLVNKNITGAFIVKTD